jgi:exodeoxyribonuclease VII large subunit
MEQLSLFVALRLEPYTVSQLLARVRATVEADPLLTDLWVEGEVSNFRQATSGHCYFTLKDAGAELHCVMWRDIAQTLSTLPAGGEQVLVLGRVGVYEQRGSLQLYVEHLEPSGVGLLYREFERLRVRLEAEGLFDPARRRPLPDFPRRIGVVTSPTAAALRDVLHVLERRYPFSEVVLSPALVQGTDAPPQIEAALARLNTCLGIDVILLVRGGGSLEELWAFNDERVVRAVAGSRVPVVCGVGHETDITLADFAADARAPTPSAAAEMATPDRQELRDRVEVFRTRTAGGGRVMLQAWHAALTEKERVLKVLTPLVRVAQARQRTDDLADRAADLMSRDLSLRKERLLGLVGRIDGLSPLAVLERGYALVRRRDDGRLVRSVTQVEPGDGLRVRVSDGELEATAR